MLPARTTVIVDVLLLLSPFGSTLLVKTLAVFDTGPGVEGSVTCRLMLADAALTIVPRLQVTVVVPLQLPWVGVAETKVTPAGRMSVTATLVADPGPAFATTMVYVSGALVP